VVTGPPIVLYRVDVLRKGRKYVILPQTHKLRVASSHTYIHDLREQGSVERMRLMGGARPWNEQVSDPFPSIGQTAPQRVRSYLALDQLLPQHTLGDDAQPFFAHQLGGAQRVGVQIRQNTFRNVFQSFFCEAKEESNL
jgi:hypothetical protein